MTTDRYTSYRRAISSIVALEEAAPPEATWILRDSAEGLLLSQAPHAEADELYNSAAVVLVQLIAGGVASRSLADRLMDALRDCGPRPAAGKAPERSTTVRSETVEPRPNLRS